MIVSHAKTDKAIEMPFGLCNGTPVKQQGSAVTDITVNILQTKVDTQYDKLATELAAVDVFELFVESPQF